MSERLKIAITKGRLLDKSVELFEAAGLDCAPIRDPGRRLVHSLPNYPLDAVLPRPPDVITYVEHGVCDMGIVGKDTILEKGGSFYEVLDLGFGRCRLPWRCGRGATFTAPTRPGGLPPSIQRSPAPSLRRRAWMWTSSRLRAVWNWPQF